MNSAWSDQGSSVRQISASRQRPASPFMPVKEAATFFGVSEMTIRRAVASGAIPGIHWGRTFRVLRAFAMSVLNAAEAGQQVDIEEFAASWPGAAAPDVPEVVA